MTQPSPDPRSRINPRAWGVGTILLLLAVAAGFVVMLTWDRGHFEQQQPTAVQKPGSK